MSVGAGVNERLAALTAAGTSVWLDQIRRSLITSGELERLERELSLRGVTSNPAIFEKAILGSTDYDEQIARAGAEGAVRARDLRRDRGAGRAARLRRAAPGLGRGEPRGRLRLARGGAGVRARHRRHAEAGARVLGARRPPEPDDQDPGHRGGRARHRGGDRRRDQRERDAAVLRGVVHGDRRGIHPRYGAPPRGRRVARRALRGQLLRVAGGHGGGQAPRRVRPGRAARNRGRGERPSGIPALQGAVPRRALRGAPRCRCDGAAAAVGLHRREGPALPGDQVRGLAGGAGHREHDADADPARLRRGARGERRHGRPGPGRRSRAPRGRGHRHG